MNLKPFRRWRERTKLERFRQETWNLPPNSIARCLDFEVKITDGPNFYIQFKDEFIQRIYHFKSERPDPVVIDGGSNIGMSILYFKSIYPQARIIGFEPDPAIFQLLKENMERNKISGVQLVNAGLAAQTGTATFAADGSAGGSIGSGQKTISIRVEQLSKYLDQPVDFLKLNIEGQELPVLQEAEAAGKLRQVRQMVLEYHGWPDGKQALGEILSLLERQGFRYLIHDFDAETCGRSKPPFSLDGTPWFCLVYAKNTSS